MANHEQIASLSGCAHKPADAPSALQLESVYRRYGTEIYTLCLRLLADEKAAESATVGVFVKLGREIASHSDESCIRLRLCELAINASLVRLNRFGAVITRWLSQGLRLKTRQL